MGKVYTERHHPFNSFRNPLLIIMIAVRMRTMTFRCELISDTENSNNHGFNDSVTWHTCWHRGLRFGIAAAIALRTYQKK